MDNAKEAAIAVLRGIRLSKQMRQKKALEYVCNGDLRLEAEMCQAEIEGLSIAINALEI